MDYILLLHLSLIACATSAFTAICGVGGGATLILILELIFPMSTALPIHAAIQAASNLSRVGAYPNAVQWKILRPYFFGTCLGVASGLLVLIKIPDDLLSILLALFILLTTWIKLPPLPAMHQRVAFFFLGIVSSVLSLFIGISGPLALPILLAQGLGRNEVVVTAAGMAFLVHCCKMITYAGIGFPYSEWASSIAWLVSATTTGSIIGTCLRHRVSETHFKVAIKMVLTTVASIKLAHSIA